ncbi:MAG TPA: hypothetical protein VHF70_11375 [Rubrobacteraceae bacterium]|nr:hypothetical protein [Rubrobacteraceae bacterium]
MRLLLAFEEDYTVYRDVIGGAIRAIRPHATVSTSALAKLGEHIEALNPDLVISTQANSTDLGGRPAWVELSVDPLRPTKICVGGRRSERTNPSVEILLEVIDEVERAVGEGEYLRGC